MRALALVPLVLPVLLFPLPAGSQYLYLDTNGDGFHDVSDQLAPSGPTMVDVWLVTDQNRDGTPAICDTESGTGLTMNSYTIVLRAAGGEVEWGPMQNRVPFEGGGVCFASREDTTDVAYYHNGWGWKDIFPPGKYRLATLQVTTTMGHPSLYIEPYLPRRPVLLTQFGTKCPGLDGDNTYKLGSEWHDADGAGPMRASAGGPYRVRAGQPLLVSAADSRSGNGTLSSYSWHFGDGATGTGQVTSHVYAEPGDYTLILTAQNNTETDSDTTVVHVVPVHAPVAGFLAPGTAYIGQAALFDGRISYDVDGDHLTYSWDFGDGTSGASAASVTHVYQSAGDFTVTLVVSDGTESDTATRQVTVFAQAHPPDAAAGGPYTGLAGRTIQFDGSRSTDPDRDPLTFAWTFGDGQSGIGAITGHAYAAAGTYTVRLTVSDGRLTGSAFTGVTVIGSLPARAFGDPPGARVVLGDDSPLTVRIEPVNGAFRIDDVDPWPVLMRSTGTGSVGEIASVDAATLTEDSDGNGARELTMTFSAEELALLLGGVERPAVVTVNLKGSFFGGGSFDAELRIEVFSPDEMMPLRISPNPFNPEAVVTFSTSRAGPVRAHLFDVHGRLVRRVLEDAFLGPGHHVLRLSAHAEAGSALASGVYFFRLIGPDGVTTKRVAIAK